MRRRDASIGIPAEGSVYLKRGRGNIALEDIFWVLVHDRNGRGGDGGARVGWKRESRIRQRRGAGICGGRVEWAVVNGLWELAMEGRAGL